MIINCTINDDTTITTRHGGALSSNAAALNKLHSLNLFGSFYLHDSQKTKKKFISPFIKDILNVPRASV